ncbi:hypothetical protein [Colwellia piezophila]|uniref:hypothetical protein n=1 Tax=Colwellia piezophila TaxID=211668 RepID=UPI00039D3A45|nr:hypothetical protein [Colwellia piezophila]
MKHSIKIISLLTAVCLMSACSLTKKEKTYDAITFIAFGDTPYETAPIGAAKTPFLNAFLGYLNQTDTHPLAPEFTIHVGDFIKGSESKKHCNEKRYIFMKDALTAKLKTPAFIIPGDNEYNDCGNRSEAIGFWHTYLGKLEDNWSLEQKTAFALTPVNRQNEQQDNFSFVRQGVLFIGINLVGSRVRDVKEWDARINNNISWLTQQIEKNEKYVRSVVIFAHADPIRNINTPKYRNAKYMKAVMNNILSLSTTTGKPFLFIHGDYHFFESEYSWYGKNILRVMVGQKMDKPIVITVTNDINTPFIVNDKDDHFKIIVPSLVPESATGNKSLSL